MVRRQVCFQPPFPSEVAFEAPAVSGRQVATHDDDLADLAVPGVAAVRDGEVCADADAGGSQRAGIARERDRRATVDGDVECVVGQTAGAERVRDDIGARNTRDRSGGQHRSADGQRRPCLLTLSQVTLRVSRARHPNPTVAVAAAPGWRGGHGHSGVLAAGRQ